jgi:hypothetical protein
MSKGFLFAIPVIIGLIVGFLVPETWNQAGVAAIIAVGGSIGLAFYLRNQKHNDEPDEPPK